MLIFAGALEGALIGAAIGAVVGIIGVIVRAIQGSGGSSSVWKPRSGGRIRRGDYRDDLDLEDAVLPVRERASNGSSAVPYAANATTLEDFNLDAVTQRLVVAALEKTRGHKAQAATLLGVHPRTLTRMLRRYGLPD